MSRSQAGFTVVEMIIIIVVIAILATITMVSYNGVQNRADKARVISTARQVTDLLGTHGVKNGDFPPNLAGTGYAGPDNVALVLYTNAPQKRVYEDLSSDENAQLFLNTCNANMPIVATADKNYNTVCYFHHFGSLRWLYVRGGDGWSWFENFTVNYGGSSGRLDESDFKLKCGSACDIAVNKIKQEFIDQGGSWPVIVPYHNIALPEPTLTTYGRASKFCLESRSTRSNDVIYHSTDAISDVATGPCPADPELHYP
ncbi:hypothetical protein CR969_03245 [Candidatus Saccharibacteria bacterium]|nr:MAG: hypothetical protein CR969_03245 [Candidatus Saccharibacteria bacterium]